MFIMLIYLICGLLYTGWLVSSLGRFGESNIKWRVFIVISVFVLWPILFLWDLWCLLTA